MLDGRQARIVTSWLIVVAIGLLIAWDFVAEWRGGSNATISEVTLHFLYLHPAVAVGLGGLLGHLTWPRETKLTWMGQLIVVSLSLLALVGIDLAHILAPVTPVWPLLAGIPVGHGLWCQSIDDEHYVHKSGLSAGRWHDM